MVKACGESRFSYTIYCSRVTDRIVFEALTQLDVACRAPAEKAAVLVASHKIIVGQSMPDRILQNHIFLDMWL